MRILIASNAPWAPTGYGEQGASLARRLRDAGHAVTYYCNYGLQGGVVDWNGIRCLPNNGFGYVDPIIKGHLRYVQPDLLITLHDLWVWNKSEIPAFIREQKIRWAAWFPVDALPISESNQAVLSQVDYPISMANFAERELREKFGHPTTVIPHGIEKDFGYTAHGRREFRRYLQVPDDAFLFGSVGRNAYYPGRKGFDRLIRAFAEMPEDCYLYIHALQGSEYGSVALPDIARFYGVEDRVMYQDDYNGVMGYSKLGLASLYSAFDCYVQPTLGEGFGIPVLEAQACGAVVIATDCTSMPELLCPEASQLVPGATELFVPDPSHRVLIDIPQLVSAMKEIYQIKHEQPDGFRAMKARAGMWANAWDWDKLWAEEWTPLLKKIEEEIKEEGPRAKYHRGAGLLYEHEGRMRKADSSLKSPAVKKELDLLETLDHPNIIPVLAKGQKEDGMWWFDMPKGTPLREATDVDADKVVAGVRAALTYLHERGIAHRDVCPENIILSPEGEPWLIDFEWAHPCDGTIGKDCVDFEPWQAIDRAVQTVQWNIGQRGLHTIVSFVKGVDISDKSHGFKGVPYQQIAGVGERDCQPRWDMMKLDVSNKSVLDVGCNLGWFVRQSLESGARRAVGVDNDAAVVEAAKTLGEGEFLHWDLNLDGLRSAVLGEFDVIFLLSVLQHLERPDKVLEEAMRIGQELYIEIPPRFITDYMAGILKDSECLGETERGRPLYRVRTKVAAAV